MIKFVILALRMSVSEQIDLWMNNALHVLRGALQHECVEVATHRVLTVTGWNDSAEVRQSIARYLVGLRVCAISAALAIRTELADTDQGRLELARNVFSIVGDQPGTLTEQQVRTSRNPWIAEGLWHLCFAVAKDVAGLHPPGQVVAVNLPHPKASDHGVDVAVLYRVDPDFGLSIVETKAYPEHVGNAVQNSIVFFRDVDRGEHSLRIRQVIATMRAQLPQADQSRISQTLWQERRIYVANPHYDLANAPDWTNEHPALAGLAPGAGGVFLMPHGIDGFDAFFDNLAAEMRAAVAAV